METQRVDVAVIGAGTAGLNARGEAEKRGARALLIESGPYGTTCARVGCMPSKLLIAAADAHHAVSGAGRFGIRLDAPARVDGPAVLARVQRERDRFVGFVVESTEKIPEELRLRGHARFVGPTTLEVDDVARVEARAVVIAAGTTPMIPPALEPVRDHVITSDEIFELRDLPESVVVIGAGVIGMELGQALHRLGVRTTVIARSRRPLGLTDPVVANEAARLFGDELPIHFEAQLEHAEPGPDGDVRVRWRARSGEHGEERASLVLAAAGRRPNLEGLGVETTGLELDGRGIPRFDPRTLQCGSAPVFVAGDFDGERPVLHEAADEGRFAGANAARFPDVLAHARRTPLAIAFTRPEVALVGRRFAELPEGSFAIGEVDYGDQGRARVMGENAGRVRVYADPESGALLGAEMLGPRVEHTAHLLAWAIQNRIHVSQALASPFYHPVIEEGIRTALRDVCEKLRMRGPVRDQDMEGGPGD